MESILVSWLGRTDLRAVTESDQVGIGPIAQALCTGRFTRLELLCDCPTDETDAYLDWLRPQTETRIAPHPVTLPSPTDFDAIYRHARNIAAQAAADAGGNADRLTFHLSPGTPAMAAVWIILAKTRFPAELIESELFGHEKGAFTGAASARKGVFEAADTGTLFLDEIGELPKPAQVRFLRALQEGEVTRIGTTEPIRVDVRIIAATNRSLTQEVSADRFREDLFYRLTVAVIALPPLRERDGDAALLPCPGNSNGQDPVLSHDVRQGIDLNGIIDRVARHYLEQAMHITGDNKTRAAKLLGFGNPTTLTNWLKKHGVEP